MALHSNFGIIANFAGLFTMTGNDLKDSHPREKGKGPAGKGACSQTVGAPGHSRPHPGAAGE